MITKETKSIRTNTTVSLPSAFKGETISPVDPNNVCMSIVPRGIKIVSKITSFPEIFILQFFESNYVSDPQLSAIRDLIKMKDPKTHEKSFGYELLLFPIFPECKAAGKNLKHLFSKNQIGNIPETKELNKSVQLDFWGTINYLNESQNYVLMAVDRFLRWPSAMVCGNNRSDKIMKFLEKKYIANHGVPRKIHMHQETSFMSNGVKAFCNGEGIEDIKSPVNDHRATGCIERTIDSFKNSILTFEQERHPKPLEKKDRKSP